MTKEIKEKFGDELKSRCEEIGEKELIEKIADESATPGPSELLQFLQKVKHTALEMEPLMQTPTPIQL